MTSLFEIWNTPLSEIKVLLKEFGFHTEDETRAYLHATQVLSNKLPPKEREIVEGPYFHNVMLETHSLSFKERLTAGIIETSRLKVFKEIEKLNSTIKLLNDQIELKNTSLINRKFQVENCPLNPFDEELNNVIDPISFEPIKTNDFTRVNNKYCYNNSTLEDLIRIQKKPTDPITREPFSPEIIQKFLPPRIFGRLMDQFGSLNLSNLNLKSQDLEGIEWPQELKELSLSANQLTTFDVSSLPRELIQLDFFDNQLTHFDTFSLPPGLKTLNLKGNHLTTFDVSYLPRELIELNLSRNRLTTFDVSSLPRELKALGLAINQLTTFDTSSLPQSLQELYLSNNQLNAFDTSSLPRSLQYLSLNDNQLNTFDTTSLPEGLKQLRLENNPLGNFQE